MQSHANTTAIDSDGQASPSNTESDADADDATEEYRIENPAFVLDLRGLLPEQRRALKAIAGQRDTRMDVPIVPDIETDQRSDRRIELRFASRVALPLLTNALKAWREETRWGRKGERRAEAIDVLLDLLPTGGEMARSERDVHVIEGPKSTGASTAVSGP